MKVPVFIGLLALGIIFGPGLLDRIPRDSSPKALASTPKETLGLEDKVPAAFKENPDDAAYLCAAYSAVLVISKRDRVSGGGLGHTTGSTSDVVLALGLSLPLPSGSKGSANAAWASILGEVTAKTLHQTEGRMKPESWAKFDTLLEALVYSLGKAS